MKKNIVLFFVIVFFVQLSVFADSWDDFSNVDRMWDGQKSITNKEFENVINALEEKGKQKEEKKIKKKRKKLFGNGTTLHSELNPDNDSIQEFESIKPDENGSLVNLSVHAYLNGKSLEKGYYNVFARRDEENKKIYISFYQSQYLKGEIEGIETDDDFGEEALNFARIIPYNDSFVKIIFGSIDFNAYAYIPYVE